MFPSHRRRRWASAAGMSTALVLVASACGGDDQTGDGSSQTADTISVAIASSPSADALQAIAADFEDETGVTVEFVDIPYEQLASQILLGANQPDQGFDVVQFDSPMMAALVEAGAIADLTERIESSEAYNADDFSDQVNEYAQYDGTSYGIPLSTEPYVLWYRTDLFQNLGLSPDPTWDSYVANARALQASGIAGNGSGFGAQIGGYYWLEAIYLHGGSLLEPGTCTASLNTPQALEATETYLDLLDTTPASVVNGGGNEMTTAFAQGQVGQQINATGYWSTIADPAESQIVDDFDMTLPPMTEDGNTLLFGWLIGVGAQSEAQDTAWQFLEYALGKDAMTRLIEEGAPPPARQSLLEDDAALEAIPYLPTLIEAAGRGDHLPYITQMPEIITALSVKLNEAATSGMDAQALLDAAQSDVESIMSGAENCG
jgi:multiple sugar transport system substrate-binding protein